MDSEQCPDQIIETTEKRRIGVYVDTIALIILAALMLSVYYRTLGSYFLADDFGEIAYVKLIADGRLDLLWSNFTGNYMQIPNMAVYRPWLLITILADYLLWGANPAGYFATNLLHYLGCGGILYCLVRSLTNSWDRISSVSAAFFSAALFLLHPLHGESVSWMVGRVDIVCLMYSLLSLFLVTRFRSTSKPAYLISAVLSYVIAIGTKEMAICVPFLVLALVSLFKSKADTPRILITFFAITCLYFAMRYLFLGTILGGYQGSIGESQLSNLFARWTDRDSWSRIILPFNQFVFHDAKAGIETLSLFYWMLISLVTARIAVSRTPVALLIFLLIWAACSLAPVYKLLGIGHELEGSRFVFFFTAPLSLLFPILLIYPGRIIDSNKYNPRFDGGLLRYLSLAALCLLCFAYGKIAYKNNLVWVHAGKEVHRLQEKALELAANHPGEKRLALLGIPKRHGGAHMILNGATFAFLTAPPFVTRNVSNRFKTFDPMLFGDERLVNTAFLKETLSCGDTEGIWVWRREKQEFEKLSLEGESTSKFAKSMKELLLVCENSELQALAPPKQENISLSVPYTPDRGYLANNETDSSITTVYGAKSGLGLRISGLDMHPAEFDFLELELAYTPAPEKESGLYDNNLRNIELSWKGDTGESQRYTCPASTITKSERACKARFRLSQYWQWFSCGNINTMLIELPPCSGVSIKRLSLLPEYTLAPSVDFKATTLSPTGANVPDLASGNSPSALIDASNLTNATYLRLDIFATNYFIDNEPDREYNAALVHSLTKEGKKAEFALPSDLLSQPGFVQMRARALDENKSEIGEYSTIQTFKTGK